MQKHVYEEFQPERYAYLIFRTGGGNSNVFHIQGISVPITKRNPSSASGPAVARVSLDSMIASATSNCIQTLDPSCATAVKRRSHGWTR